LPLPAPTNFQTYCGFILFFLFLEKKKETKKIQDKRDAPPLCRASPSIGVTTHFFTFACRVIRLLWIGSILWLVYLRSLFQLTAERFEVQISSPAPF